MDVNQICHTLSRAVAVARAYDYKINCGHQDVCAVIRDYFGQRLLDLDSTCEDSEVLSKHLSCQSYPAAPGANVTTLNCPVTITDVDPVSCGTVTITVVQ